MLISNVGLESKKKKKATKFLAVNARTKINGRVMN